MRTVPATLVALVTLAATAVGQSPLTTTYAANGGGSPGGQVMFDLTVSTTVTLTRLDVHVSDSGGAVGTVELWLTPNTHVGNTTSPGPWSLAGSGTVMSRGFGRISSLALPAGVVLTPGSCGVAVRYVGLSFLRTSGSATYSTTELTLTTGGVQNVPWGAFFTPRQWNGALHYEVGNVTGPFALAETNEFGVGCDGLTLASTGAPLLGSAVTLTTSPVTPTATIGATVYGLARFSPGNSLAALGAPNCFEHVATTGVKLAFSPGASFQDTLAIPATPGLLGAAVCAQSAVFDPSLTAGFATSNGIELVLGNT